MRTSYSILGDGRSCSGRLLGEVQIKCLRSFNWRRKKQHSKKVNVKIVTAKQKLRLMWIGCSSACQENIETGLQTLANFKIA